MAEAARFLFVTIFGLSFCARRCTISRTDVLLYLLTTSIFLLPQTVLKDHRGDSKLTQERIAASVQILKAVPHRYTKVLD